MSIDIGLLLLRALVGFVLFAHTTQKLMGWVGASDGVAALIGVGATAVAVLAALGPIARTLRTRRAAEVSG